MLLDLDFSSLGMLVAAGKLAGHVHTAMHTAMRTLQRANELSVMLELSGSSLNPAVILHSLIFEV